MQFNKVLWALIFVFMVGCWQSALAARLHQKGRSAAVRIFPLHQRKLTNHGRSSAPGSAFDTAPATAATNGEEGRGLMKKFMLFKSLFYQEKSEPSNNIIIITQPAPTGTSTTGTQPTTTDTTGTSTTTAAATPTGTNTGRDSKTELDENDDTIKELENSQAQEIVQELITQTKPKRKRLNKFTEFNENNLQNENQKPRKRRIRLSKRKQLRKRMPTQQTQTQSQQQHQQQTNTINVGNLLNNMNLTKRPNQHAKHNSNNNTNNHNEEESNNNNSNKNNNNNNNASGILNLNTNMRLQNIMNAFRKQTPIMYNY